MDSGPLMHANGQILREAQPAFPSEFQQRLGHNLYTQLPAGESPLREYFRTLVKRRWVIVASLAGDLWSGCDRHNPGDSHFRRIRQHRDQQDRPDDVRLQQFCQRGDGLR